MARKSPLLAPLFSPITQSVLVATVLRPAHEWYLSDLATHLGVGPSSLQRTMVKLTAAGILTRRKNGNRVYYRPDSDCPILADLANMLTKTVGVVEPLRDALMPFAGRIRVAFIHGSMAEERERSESDVDLIIIGDVKGPDLTAALRPLHDRLGRPVNFTRYTAREFQAKVADGNHFLTSVLKKRRVFLIGDDNELDQIIERGSGSPGTDKQEGA